MANTFIDRLVVEKEELSEKKAKLNAFIENSEMFMSLDEADRDMLEVQFSAMETYLRCLISRIRMLNK
jgi:hypothetical protein